MLFNAINDSTTVTPSTPASHIETPLRTAAISLSTLQALFRLSSSNDHKDHAAREQTSYSDIISSCVLSGVWGGHAGVELAALTAALITTSRYAGP